METATAPRKEKAAKSEIGATFDDALLRKLLTEANRSPDREAYRELGLGPCYRLGIEVTSRTPRAPRYILVVLIDSLHRGPQGRIAHGRLARVERALGARGYASTRLDNGWMVHERSLAPSRLSGEWRFVRKLLETEGPMMGACA